MKSSILLSTLLGASVAVSQISSLSELKCPPGFSPGVDTVIYTIPYTYAQAMSIIGDYQNLTWSGSPDGSVTLNGTDNTVGTARTYDLDGAHVVETLQYYSKPADGPYVEIHDLALLTVPSANLTVSAPYDGATVTSTCNGRASIFNLTTLFCASNVTVGGELFHQLHMGDAMTVGVFLGNKTFTSCEALASGSATATMTATKTATASPAAFTGTGARTGTWVLEGGVFLITLCVAALML